MDDLAKKIIDASTARAAHYADRDAAMDRWLEGDPDHRARIGDAQISASSGTRAHRGSEWIMVRMSSRQRGSESSVPRSKTATP